MRVRPHAWRWYKTIDQPVYMTKVHPEIAASVAYPWQTMVTHFGSRHFLSSFDWMMAMAVFEEFERIDIHNFEMRNPAYEWQLPSAFEWVARARSVGIAVVVHGESALNPSNKLYGFEAVTRQELFGTEQ